MAGNRTGALVAVVLAGGGARGAYEAGALSILLPVLEQRGERPAVVIGTSAGALNASYLAATAHLPASDLMAAGLGIWESIGWAEVVRPLVSSASLMRLGSYLGEAIGLPGVRLESLLDAATVRDTVRALVDFNQLERNVKTGEVVVAGVVATSALTSRSVVFHRGLESPVPDARRGIDYVATRLRQEHVLASAAIPVIFPAVHVERPRQARGWYVDGGTRLNTPIKPALAFGAERVVVIALNSLASGPPSLAGEERPDALQGAGQVLLSLLEDQLAHDVQTLAATNTLVSVRGGSNGDGKRQVPYIVVSPRTRTVIGEIALRVVRKHYSGPLGLMRSPDLALLARLVAGGADRQHAELLSFLLFAPEFAHALIELGQEDARAWLEAQHDLDDLWQVGPVTPSE